MLGYESGIIGFPLRLLAREVFDKCIKKVGVEKVALITGEEKIIPKLPKYYIAMTNQFIGLTPLENKFLIDMYTAMVTGNRKFTPKMVTAVQEGIERCKKNPKYNPELL